MHEIIYDDANICTMGGATRIIDCPAQLLVCLTKDHAVTAPGRRVGCFEPGRPATYYKDASRGRRSRELLDDFGANRRIDRAGDMAQRGIEEAAEASLIAADAGAYILLVAGETLCRQIWIRNKGPHHRNHVGNAVGDNAFGVMQIHDAASHDRRRARRASYRRARRQLVAERFMHRADALL